MINTELELNGLESRTLAPGEVLMTEGTPADRVYVLKSGTVSVSVEGQEIHCEDERGAFFGEISVLLKQDHSATVTAVEPCEFAVIRDLPAFIQDNPHIAIDVARILAERVIRLHSALIEPLRQALVGVKTLQGLIPICANCKKVRDEDGFWRQVESYVRDHSEATFSHGLCPTCAAKFLREVDALADLSPAECKTAQH